MGRHTREIEGKQGEVSESLFPEIFCDFTRGGNYFKAEGISRNKDACFACNNGSQVSRSKPGETVLLSFAKKRKTRGVYFI